MKRKVTPKNLKKVFDNILKQCASPIFARQFCWDLNQMLDDQVADDLYGTEAQCDPRGDQRN